jgi:hypothetical protein
MTAQLIALWILLGDAPAAPAPPAPSDGQAESIDVRYARAQMQLAEANLRRVTQMNERVARVVPASVVAEYRSDLEVANQQMREAQRAEITDVFAVWLHRAESVWKEADTMWKNAVAVNRRSASTFESLDVERFRLRAEVTRLQFERGKLLAGAPREAQLQWQLDVVNYDVQRLKEDARAANFARSGRVWWW